MPNEPNASIYEPVEEAWLEDPQEEDLPRRPRRRLLGVGGNPIPLALIGVLLIACGFIGGVLVEKGQSSSNSATGGASGLASRFAALRGAAGAGGSLARSTSGGSGASLFGGGGASRVGATVGQVSYVSGHTLYVTNAEGNTVKVTTSAASTVSKTVASDVKGIHPGETVIVTGSGGANGAISAESIRVSEAGASAGPGAVLFGGSSGSGSRGSSGGGSGGSSSGGSSGSGGAGSGGGGEPALFGK